MYCEACHKEANGLITVKFQDDEVKCICPKCNALYEMMADMEYERQKEEGLFKED